MDLSPLSIVLVKNGSRGDRLLFKYPYNIENKVDKCNVLNNVKHKNTDSSKFLTSKYLLGNLIDFSDKVLSNLFAVNKNLCGDNLELKVNDIRFVGHPYNLEETKKLPKEMQGEKRESSIISFIIVFALKASISLDIVNCYYELSKKLAIALSHEERRCQFLCEQATIMLKAQDESSQQPEESESSFDIILRESILAKHIKKVYDDLCLSGEVHLDFNKWINISFCLPQMVPHGSLKGTRINSERMLQCMQQLKAYHTLLLLVNKTHLLQQLPLDASPHLQSILASKTQTHLHTFAQLASLFNLTLPHILQMAVQLVYWGKAIIIYPIRESNKYVVSPVCLTNSDELKEKFESKFDSNYLEVLESYAQPISILDKCCPVNYMEHERELDQLCWLLQHGLIQQVHTFVYICIEECPLLESNEGNDANFTLDTLHESTETTQVPFETRTNTYMENGDDVQVSHMKYDNLNLNHSSHMNHTLNSQFQLNFEDELDSRQYDNTYADLNREEVTRILRQTLKGNQMLQLLQHPAAKDSKDLALFARLLRLFDGEHHLESIVHQCASPMPLIQHVLHKFRSLLVFCRRPDAIISFMAGLT